MFRRLFPALMATLLVGGVTAPAYSQGRHGKTAPPAATPQPEVSQKSTAPTLDDAMDFFVRMVNSAEQINYTIVAQDHEIGQQTSNFAVAQQASSEGDKCIVSYYLKDGYVHGNDAQRTNFVIDVRDISYTTVQDASDRYMERDRSVAAAYGVSPSDSAQAMPDVYLLRMQTGSGVVSMFYFPDRDSATRALNALNYASRLCKGVSTTQDPF